jgi:1-acyl-sn-glycerol-3-phosphate acyltransferase
MERLSPAYRAVMLASWLPLVPWGRIEVSGLEHLPESGPVLLAGNHDSYWDPIAVGFAARRRRQIHALAKDTLWKFKPVGVVLDAMGQIPIKRGAGDADALSAAVAALRAGKCIGVFLEGTRSLGKPLRARSGFGRLAAAVPEAEIVCVTVVGTTDVAAFPTRPAVSVRFFRPAGGGLQPGESAAEFGTRLLEETRAEAPVVAAGRRRRAALAAVSADGEQVPAP